jgi:hypothetical protein
MSYAHPDHSQKKLNTKNGLSYCNGDVKIKKMSISCLIVLVVIGTVFISGCGTQTNYKQFNGKLMSFQYPEGYTVEEATNNTIVNLTNNIDKNDVMTISYVDKNSYEADLTYAPSSGYYRGTYTPNDSEAEDVYSVYEMSKNNKVFNKYFLKKNGKYYEIIGLVTDNKYMDQIATTMA